MDRLMATLSRLDWTCVESAERESRGALEELCRPGALRELLAGVLKDERLLSLSERHSWGDRLVLWDDPVNQWRIRLHRFEDRADEPHSHRWPFHTQVLHGSYHHAMYGSEKWVRSVMENGGALPPPSLVRTERAGSSYTIDDEMVHYVKTEADTFSVIVQGPRLKERALRVRNGAIVWQQGRKAQNDQEIRSVLTTADRIEEIAEIAYGFGLLDSPKL
jgi:hypothetical protein